MTHLEWGECWKWVNENNPGIVHFNVFIIKGVQLNSLHWSFYSWTPSYSYHLCTWPMALGQVMQLPKPRLRHLAVKMFLWGYWFTCVVKPSITLLGRLQILYLLGQWGIDWETCDCSPSLLGCSVKGYDTVVSPFEVEIISKWEGS